MNRRKFLKLAAAAFAALAVPRTPKPARGNAVQAGGLGAEEPSFRPLTREMIHEYIETLERAKPMGRCPVLSNEVTLHLVDVGDDMFYVPVYDYPLSCTGVPAGHIRARAEQLLAEGVDRGQAWMMAVMEEVE